MPAHRWLLLAFAGFVAVHAVGAFFGSPLLPSSGALAWVALAGYAVVAGRHAPRAARLALVAGLLVFGGWAAVQALTTTTTDTDFGWFAYTSQASLDLTTAWSRGLREIAPWLIGYGCLTVAAFAMGTRAPGPHGRFVGIFGAALALGWGLLVLSSRADGVREWLAYPVALLPPAVLAVAAFVAAGRVAARPLAAGGLILVGLAALALYDGALAGMWQWRPGAGGVQVLSTGSLDVERAAAAVMVSVSGPGSGPDAWAVLAVAVPLVAAAAVTIGCLRRPLP